MSAHLHNWIDLIFGYKQRGTKEIAKSWGGKDLERGYKRNKDHGRSIISVKKKIYENTCFDAVFLYDIPVCL